ncbi:hypothetical protein BOX15_Mlig026890g3 [Macrostomum lignano]|uniref:Uncharacterized protein n=2 Tax=Macrostomum lignano TaxID=282301 RepID=A0A267EA59_9PLAT|nr:hypothetical protein BOX15_Mlig026890g3 [Macrostomum lignano]
MAMQVIPMEPNGEYNPLKLRGNNQALENKRRNESVNEILKPPPQPLAREDQIESLQAYANAAELNSRAQQYQEEATSKKAANPFASESAAEKAARQQREAEEDIRRYKEERQRQLLEQNLEKKRDLQMLQSYYPWGRPGHGAPIGSPDQQESLRKQKLQLSEADDSGRQDAFASGSHSGENEGLALNRPGHGAPLRTQSGRLIAQLQGDPALRFRARDTGAAAGAAGHRGRDPAETLRYRQPDRGQGYARDLDLHIQQQKQQRELERTFELQEELNSLQYDPFGKPGAGAPNVKQPMQQQQQQLHQRRQEAAELAADFDYAQNPQVLQHHYQHEQQYGRQDEYSGMRQPLHQQSPEAGQFHLSRHHPHDTQSAPNPRSELSQLQQQQPGYEPFGRPGAGAPLRDRDGRIVPSVFGATAKFEETPGEKQKKAEAAKIYSQELERGLIEQSLNKRLEEQQRRAPMENPIADQLSRSSVGKPPRDPRTGVLLDQHLPSSDVTHINYKTPRHKFQSMTGYQPLPAFVQTASGYGSELEQAAMERAAARRIDRAREMHEADRHAQAFDRMFGRPGAGAPVPAGAKKVNLDKALHNPDGMRNEYKKTVEHVTQVPSTSYVRNNNGSNHGNAYQIQSNGSDAYRQPYNLLAPYAIQKQA